MEAINFRNYVKLKKSFKDIPALEKKLREKTTKLVESLRKKIETEIQGSGWDLVGKDKAVEIVDDTKDRGSIFIKKKDVDYKIGIEHFNPNFDDSKLRPDNIFCGRLDKKANEDRDDKWTDKKMVSDYKGIELKTNSMEYVNILLEEDLDKFAEHLLKDFKKYFDKNKK